MPTDKFRQKHPKNRHTKTHLVFDEEKRRDFLSGFQKRKKERKRVAREQQELQYKEEKQKIRQETRKARQAGWKDLNFPDEVTEVKDSKPIVFDHAEHTVTVESVGGVTVEALDLLAAHGGIGENKVEYEDDDVEENALSRLKGLAEYDDDDDENESDEDNNEDVPKETKAKDRKIQSNKKSSKLQKLQSKLNRSRTGHRGGSSSARHKGGHKGSHKETESRGVKRLGHRGKKQRGNRRGGHSGKRR
ncbi:nucleolar protein 12-like [Patiria miniata]|uniref:Nucleolar protein 12 n=1 Tax=Patiria miniata TaxID=46514 RepID=A0A914B1C7_PATMI|nr:nucleolar protein 12-like [Patiria miniata]